MSTTPTNPAPSSSKYSSDLQQVLSGGTIQGGTVAVSEGAQLVITQPGGTLDGVTLNGDLHLLGTARMGEDPATSVTDRFNKTHDVSNLFIADASSMPTGGGVNPSATIQALALRCADHIWERRRDWSAAG